MADTRTSLERLRVDVDPMRLRPADAVRRRADRQRRRRGVAAAAMAVAVVAGGSALIPRGPEAGAPVAPDMPSPTSTATPSATPLPLLPEPWTLTTSRSTTLPASGAAGADLCGIGGAGPDWLPGRKPVELQRFELADTSVQIWVYTEGTAATSVTAANLFKAFFAGCGGPGVVESLGGPTNYWRVAASPARMAALWIDTKVYVVRMTSRGSAPPDLSDIVIIIDGRVRR